MAANGILLCGKNVMIGLMLVTSLCCFTYSYITQLVWKSHHAQNMIKRIIKDRSVADVFEEADCPVKWRNNKIKTSEYEQKQLEPPPSDVNGNYPSPVPVKPLYPNPVLKLRPDYFILPLLQNGPNNQLVGLRETIFVAIRLNRTIVVPRFIKHHTDNRTLPFVSPVHRIEVSDICTFVSCVSIEQFRKACGYQIDAVLHIRQYKKPHRRNYENLTGMKLRRNPKEGPDEPDAVLVPTSPIPGGGSSRHFHGRDIVPLFTTDARCVIYPSPLYNLHLAPLKKAKYKKGDPLVERLEDIHTLSDSAVSLSVSQRARNPEYTTTLAKEFVRVKMNRKRFVSVHWRYQPNEFMLRCNHGSSANPVKKKICANALRISPQDIAASIERKITSLKGAENPVDIKHIYFATPPTERNILEKVAQILYKKHGWLTYSSLDLTKFLNKKFKLCPKLRTHYNDILSTTEMEICAIGVSFLGSQRSSWSDVVHISRKTLKHDSIQQLQDGDIFNMSLDSMNERNVTVESAPKR